MPTVTYTYFVDDDGDKWSVAEGCLLLNGHKLANASDFADFLQSELAKAEPDKPDDDDWIEWNGGKRPVNPDALVDLITRDGDVLHRRRAEHWRWWHNGLAGDIMRYRLSKGGEE